MPLYRKPDNVLDEITLLTNKVGSFRMPRAFLAIAPTRVGDLAIRLSIFASNMMFTKICQHQMHATTWKLVDAIKYAREEFMINTPRRSLWSRRVLSGALDESRKYVKRKDQKILGKHLEGVVGKTKR